MDMLLNWLWQGCLVSIALALMLRVLADARAGARYAVCWAALLLVVLLPAMTRLVWERHTDAGVAVSSAIVAVPDEWWTSTEVITAAWLVWVAIAAARLFHAIVLLRRARRRGRPFPHHVESQLRHWRQVGSSGRPATLVLSESVATAALLGAGAPMIAVAPALIQHLESDELDRVLIHEWAHVQRRDDLTYVLQSVVHIVAGWHPAVRWIERRLHIEREIACDEAAVAVAGSPRAYAECLVKLAAVRPERRAMLAAPALRPAKDLRQRIRRIVSERRVIPEIWSRGVAVAVGCALVAVALGAAGLPLVEASVLAMPIESLRTAPANVRSVAPVGVPDVASSTEPAPQPRPSAASPRLTRRLPSDDAPATEEPVLSGNAESPAGDDRAAATSAAEPATMVERPPTELAASSAGSSDSPWTRAAEQGSAIGRKSKDAGVATARAFTRFGRRIADSF